MPKHAEPELAYDLEWIFHDDQIGDLELLAILMQDYFPIVFRLATAYCNDEEQGCRIARQAISRIVLNRQSYWDNEPFLYILYNQTYLSCLDYQREENGLNNPLFGEVLKKFIRSHSSPACSGAGDRPESHSLSQAESQENDFPIVAELQNAIHRLEGRYRMPVLLYYVTKMSAKDIAGTLHIPEAEVFIRLKLAWKKVFADLVSSSLEPVEKKNSRPGKITQDLPDIQEYGKRNEEINPAGPVRFLGWQIYIRRMADLEIKWMSWLDSLWVLPQLTRQQSLSIQNEIASDILAGAAHRRTWILLKEAAIGCVALFLTLGVVFYNRQQIRQAHLKTVEAAQATAAARGLTLQPQDAARTAAAFRFTGNTFQYITKTGDTLEALAKRLAVRVEILRLLNHLPAGEQVRSGQLLVLPASPQASGFEIPTPVPQSSLSPLSPEDYSPENIMNLIALSSASWHTLFADILSIDYGPEGYIGPPIDVVRKQVWISKPTSSLVLSGPANGPPGDVRYIRDGAGYWEDLASYSTIGGVTSTLLDDPVANALLFAYQQLSLASGNFRNLGFTEAGNSRTVVADWTSKQSNQAYRFWIDSGRGAILRLQQFDGLDFKKIVWDLSVNQIHYDVQFPEDIFDLGVIPTRQFAKDETGIPPGAGDKTVSIQIPVGAGQLPMQHIQPPGNFDPRRSRLTFEWPLGSNPDYVSGNLPIPTPSFNNGIELFAGDYYLSTLEIGTVPLPYSFNSSFPVNIQFPSIGPPVENHLLNDLVRNQAAFSCRRSGDGRYIVFRPFADKNFESLQLYWVDLLYPEELHPVSVKTDTRIASSSDDFRFSPDNRSLAYYNCDTVRGETKCGIYILNLITGEKKFLIPLEYELDLTWSPDNAYLAYVGSENFGGQPHIHVISVADGSKVYDHIFDWETRIIPNDSPTKSWGSDFPAILNNTKEQYGTGMTPVIGSGFPVPSDLQNCTEPPAH